MLKKKKARKEEFGMNARANAAPFVGLRNWCILSIDSWLAWSKGTKLCRQERSSGP
jgi:hypothetical protein